MPIDPARSRRPALIASLAVLAVAGVSILAAQPGGGAAGAFQPPSGERDAGPRRGNDLPTDGKALRAFLNRRNENLRRQVERNEAALKRLDDGADAEAVRAELLREWRERPGDEAAAPPAPAPGAKGDRPDSRKDNRSGQSVLGEPMVRLNHAERESAMSVIRDERPALAAAIEAVARTPEVGERVYDLIGFRLRGLAEVRRDREMLSLRLNEIAGLLDVMRHTADYSREKRAGAADATLGEIRAKLRAAAAEQFDVRLKIQQRSVDQLLERSEKMKAGLARLAESREKVIDEKTAQLIRLAERTPPARGKSGENSPRPRPD